MGCGGVAFGGGFFRNSLREAAVQMIGALLSVSLWSRLRRRGE